MPNKFNGKQAIPSREAVAVVGYPQAAHMAFTVLRKMS